MKFTRTFLLSFITALIMFWLFTHKNNENNRILNNEVFAYIDVEQKGRKDYLDNQIRKQNEIIKKQLIEQYEKEKRFKENEENEENLVLNSATEKKKKIVKEDFPTFQQWLNTCFFDSISIIHLHDTWKRLDLNKIYKKMWMNYWDYFLPWIFTYSKTSGWNFHSEWHRNWLDKVYEVYWFWFNQLVSISLIEEQLDNWEQWVFMAPMRFFDKDEKWLEERNENIWHAVAVYQIDNEFIYFTNTLTSKLEKIKLEEISDDWIMSYPVLFTDNKNFSKLL